MQCRHLPEPSFVHEIGRAQAEARREHAVAGSGRASALDVPEHGVARLEAGALLDLLRQLGADTAQAYMSEFVGGQLLNNDALLAGLKWSGSPPTRR